MAEEQLKEDPILTKNKETPQDKKEEELGIPKYLSQLELDEGQKERLAKEIMEEFREIEKEREEKHLVEKWDGLDAQYEGEIEEQEDRQFNLHKHSTKIKVDGVGGAVGEAFLESDPKYSVSPYPEFAKEGGADICEKQQDFLDCKMDTTIPVEQEMAKVIHSATLKGTGWLKWFHRIKREKRKREEVYEGKKGLTEFLKNYPNGRTKYKGFVKELEEGKKINIVAEYTETTYNDPFPSYIELKDLYVRTGTKGYEGMKTTRLIAEMQEYSWWELKTLEKEPNGFYDIDELMYEGKKEKDEKDPKRRDRYQNKMYKVLECVFYFKEKESDEDYVKIVCWMGKEREIVIGSIYYPLFAVDCYYDPHYIKQKVSGIYQPGVGADMTDSNIAEDALLNFILEGAWAANIVTPITSSDEIESQFLEKRWTHGIPIKGKKDEVDFLNRLKQPFDARSLLMLLQYLVQGDDDVTGHSAGMSGKESPIDPDAPMGKTIALLRQAAGNLKRYIKAMIPAFNISANIVLQIYAQMSKEGRKYKIRPERVVGKNPFGSISRAELIAKTNIQARAMAFDFDKLNQKREDVALFSMIRNELLIARNPKAVHILLKTIIKNWSPRWKNMVDELLPSLDDLQKEQVKVINQAVLQFIAQQVKQSQATGQPPQFPMEGLIALANDLSAQIATPPSEEVVKEQKKHGGEK